MYAFITGAFHRYHLSHRRDLSTLCLQAWIVEGPLQRIHCPHADTFYSLFSLCQTATHPKKICLDTYNILYLQAYFCLIVLFLLHFTYIRPSFFLSLLRKSVKGNGAILSWPSATLPEKAHATLAICQSLWIYLFKYRYFKNGLILSTNLAGDFQSYDPSHYHTCILL